jgi:hypothetical protein
MSSSIQKLARTGLLLCVLSAPSIQAAEVPVVSITTAHQGEFEKRTAAQLERLLKTHDASDWAFTRTVVIDETDIPHSHPVLTLHARHLKDDELLLSTYLHEQLHWFLSERPKEMRAAVADLRRLYPRIPVGFPQGSSDEAGNYEHLIVAYLEYQADQALLGALKAHQVMQFWSDDHYTWIYRTLLKDASKIGAIVRKHGLVPA